MTSRDDVQGGSNEELEELARVRAEVERALGAQPPDIAVLSAALEKVEDLLQQARAELAAVVREVQLSGEGPPPRRADPVVTAGASSPYCLPWWG